MKILILTLLCNFLVCCNELPVIGLNGEQIRTITIPDEYQQEFDSLCLMDKDNQQPTLGLFASIMNQLQEYITQIREANNCQNYNNTLYTYTLRPYTGYEMCDRRNRIRKNMVVLLLHDFKFIFEPNQLTLIKLYNQIKIYDIIPTRKLNRLIQNDITIMAADPDTQNEYRLELRCANSNIAQVLFSGLKPKTGLLDILSKVHSKCYGAMVTIYKTENDVCKRIRFTLNSQFLHTVPSLGQFIEIYYAILKLLESGVFPRLEDVLMDRSLNIIQELACEISPRIASIISGYSGSELRELSTEERNEIFFVSL